MEQVIVDLIRDRLDDLKDAQDHLGESQTGIHRKLDTVLSEQTRLNDRVGVLEVASTANPTKTKKGLLATAWTGAGLLLYEVLSRAWASGK